MVDAIIGGLLTNLAPLIKDEFSLLWNFREEVKNLSSTLSSIDAVLEDAERKTLWDKNKQTEDWLRKITHVAYEIRDIMDEWTFEDLRLQVKRLNASSSKRIQVTNSIALPLSNIWTSLKIGPKIKDIQKKLDQISLERTKFNLSISIHDSLSQSISLRETISKSSEKVYGREMEKEKIVNILVHSSNDAKEVYVLPIHGIGGLGKTTLAQLVFNNEDVTKHFDAKFWVYVSEEFNIKLIIKAIIGATHETSLEILTNMIQDKLGGKKYLLVLDDVWNDNVGQWEVLRSILNCGSNGAFILTTTRKKIVARIMKTVEIFYLSPLSEDDCWLLFKERAFMNETQNIVNFIGIGKKIAKKCKGVPLLAKILGSQLEFKTDVQEWNKIRDSELWEISNNEESILHILRLSYYDLPYYLRRCFRFCAIFPKDIEIEKERLIQLWMAHDLIPSNKDQELEDNGNIIWDELCRRSFFQEDKLTWKGTETWEGVETWKGVQTCKMHDLMHDLAQSIMKDECYTIDDKSSGMDFGREIRHVTIMVNECKRRVFGSLKNISCLQSIILHSNHNEKVSKETFSPFSIMKEFSSLRVFEVFIYPQNLLLCALQGCADVENLDFGSLKHLRYLNISGNEMIKTLPNSICDLLNLQTLKINNCYHLQSLPRNMKDLINLRHFHLEGCTSLKYMPRGMGQLRNLKTLSLFVMGKESGSCQLDELKELDIRGCLEIWKLENINDASIARGITMSKMSSINTLSLYWKDNDNTNNGDEKKTRHEKIGEALEVSTSCLKRLRIRDYKGVNIPRCVAESSASLTHLQLAWMDSVQMLVLFPLLEVLYIEDMKNLRELVSPITTTTGAFPNLRRIVIRYCPKLGALPRHLKSLKNVSIQGECSDELLNSISNLSGLTRLTICYLNERSVLFGAASNKALMLDDDDEAQGGRSAFQSLRYLNILGCEKLRCLFDEECEELAARGEIETRCLMNLNHLEINRCPKLTISVEHWRNLTHSLRHLYIRYCPKLAPSKVEEAEEVIAFLRSLQARLGRRCYIGFLGEEEENEEKEREAHIKCVSAYIINQQQQQQLQQQIKGKVKGCCHQWKTSEKRSEIGRERKQKKESKREIVRL